MDDDHISTSDASAAAFIERWARSGAAERANYQLFLSELCDLIGVPRPDPATPDNEQNTYVFERPVTFQDGSFGETSTGFIDLYRRRSFVCEAKQGADAPDAEEPLSEHARALKRKLRKGTARRGTAAWDDAMLRAKGQAEQYVRALPAAEGRPPFLLVVDVGHSIECYAEFSCTGGTYLPFPAPGPHRILLADLEYPHHRERLQKIWLEPLSLDPTRRSARVTRDIADRLARLAVSLEKQEHAPEIVAGFLMRCLFTMFAEDVHLLGRGSFTRLLESLRDTPEHFAPMIEELWQRMDRGGFSTSLRLNILQFNGGLFVDPSALPLNRDQLLLLIEAATCDWGDVEPAIFGTLLERALDPVERHKLGAHYTPRAYVERLVLPTIVEPVRAEWESAHAAAILHATEGDFKKANAECKAWHKKLCATRVLDPACGTGNFLYVTLEHFKRIEGEVLDLLRQFGERQGSLDLPGETVDPHQFLGIEVNPRAAAIAELVLWIGTLQWHFRTRGKVMPPQPIIRDFHNIECRDALITYDRVEPVTGDDGQPLTRWDGRTTKPHPVTGREVPDESARGPVLRYLNPQPATWPKADYIVGNPPFIGPAMMRQALGDGYTEAVRKTHKDVGESSDFVMYWWNHAARLAREGRIQRFGFVTTNSLRQTFNRRVIETHLNGKPPLSLLYAIPDHPWVDAADGAAVRIAMTAATGDEHPGTLAQVTAEHESPGDGYDVTLHEKRGVINADLTIGSNVAAAKPLRSNQWLSFRGITFMGDGFILTADEAASLLRIEGSSYKEVVRPIINGKDITAAPRFRFAIDLYGLTEDKAKREFPVAYQRLMDFVKIEREAKTGRSKDADGYAQKWWLFAKPRDTMRRALCELENYFITPMTAKWRFFVASNPNVLPDQGLIVIALEDFFYHGVLSSHHHVCWALSAGGTLEDRPRYNNSRCFETFPFPDATPEQQQRIRDLAEQLDAHRKQRQAQHAGLTMTGMYNVLEKLRSGETLTAKDKVMHEQGLVSVLKQLHDELDAAVASAYGWPADLSDDEILERLVALNAERAQEEANGVIRWLRPDFQCKDAKPTQTRIAMESTPQAVTGKRASKIPWPSALPDQMRQLRQLLVAATAPLTAADAAKNFQRAPVKKVGEILETLAALGHARLREDGRYSG